jgi:pimeloyl-ACP methyl ester carboxylesterase
MCLMRQPVAVLLLTAAVLGGCLGVGDAIPEPSASNEWSGSSSLGVGCFDVTVPVGQPPVSVGGFRHVQTTMAADLFLPVTWPKAAILLVPGGLADRKAWDGQSAGIGRDEGATLPRVLMEAGYAVVAVDRLSYPGSPLPGVDGIDIHPASDVAALEQVVDQLRQGTFSIADPGCVNRRAPPQAFVQVVGGGFSHGSFLLVDVLRGGNVTLDAAFLLAFSMYDAPMESTMLAALCTARHGDHVRHFVKHFCDDFSPPFASCVDWLTEPSTRHDASVEAACRDVQRFSEPLGFAVNPGRGPYREHLPSLPEVPVYFLNGERDRVVGKGPGPGPPPDDFGPMFSEIHARCTCQPTTVQMPDEGHMTLLHEDALVQIEAIEDWLSSALSGTGDAKKTMDR